MHRPEGGFGLTGHVMVHVQRLIRLGEGKIPDGAQQPQHVGRAAGAIEHPNPPGDGHMIPGLGVIIVEMNHVRMHFQGIFVEEALGIQRNACQHAVIQGLFRNIGIFSPGSIRLIRRANSARDRAAQVSA